MIDIIKYRKNGVLRVSGKELSFGKYIANRRKLLHMTQEDLARRMNISKSAVAKWEIDRGLPDRENLKNLSKVLGVTLDELYHVINYEKAEDKLSEVNITLDVIKILELNGYKVIRPGEDNK